MKPMKYPAKEKKEARKAEKEGGEKAKSNSQESCVTFKPKISTFAFCACPDFAS